MILKSMKFDDETEEFLSHNILRDVMLFAQKDDNENFQVEFELLDETGDSNVSVAGPIFRGNSIKQTNAIKTIVDGFDRNRQIQILEEEFDFFVQIAKERKRRAFNMLLNVAAIAISVIGFFIGSNIASRFLMVSAILLCLALLASNWKNIKRLPPIPVFVAEAEGDRENVIREAVKRYQSDIAETKKALSCQSRLKISEQIINYEKEGEKCKLEIKGMPLFFCDNMTVHGNRQIEFPMTLFTNDGIFICRAADISSDHKDFDRQYFKS